MKLKTLLQDLFALVIILAVTGFSGLFLTFFLSARAPRSEVVDWGEFLRWDSPAFQTIAAISLIMWLAYLFYFKKKM